MNLFEILKNTNSLQEKDLGELRELLCEYPYFQIAYMILAATGDKLSFSNKSIQKHSVYMTDLGFLKNAIGIDKPLPSNSMPTELSAPLPQKANADAASPHEKKSPTKHFINEYIDDLYRRPPLNKIAEENSFHRYAMDSFANKVSNSQLNLGDEANTKIFDEDLPLIDKTAFDDNLATENLAKILLDQNKIETALGVYERIMINSPDRRAALQPIVDALKEKI